MDNSTFVSLSLATAMRRDLDVTANNIANANTAGFKGERVLFQSLLAEEVGHEGTNYVRDTGSYMDASQGLISRTGNPLDVAIEGSGWMSYQTAEGQRAFGRDGRMVLDAQGNLTTLSGARVLDPGGAPLVLPPDLEGPVTISTDGTISAEGRGVLGQIGLFDVPDLQRYERLGNGMLAPPEGEGAPPLPAQDSKIVQGALEASNVQPVVEMTRMMSIQKAYDRAIKLMGSEDELRRDALRRLGKPA